MREQALQARLRHRSLCLDKDTRHKAADSLLDRQFQAKAPDQKSVADCSYPDGRRRALRGLIIDLFS